MVDQIYEYDDHHLKETFMLLVLFFFLWRFSDLAKARELKKGLKYFLSCIFYFLIFIFICILFLHGVISNLFLDTLLVCREKSFDCRSGKRHVGTKASTFIDARFAKK